MAALGSDFSEIWGNDSTGAANVFVIDPQTNNSPSAAADTFSAYIDGMQVFFRAHQACTGAATLNVNEIGAKAMVKSGGVALSFGDIRLGQIVHAIYDATDDHFEILRSTPFLSIYSRVEDRKAAGTAGGGFTSGAWRTRDLNTVASDNAAAVVQVVANQVRLTPGTYLAKGRAPAFRVDTHKLRIQDTTGAATLGIAGPPSRSDSSGTSNSMVAAEVLAEFTITVDSDIELQHWGETTKTVDGLGKVLSIDSTLEVFATLEFWRQL